MASVTISLDWDFEDVPEEEFQPYWTRSFKKTYVCSKCGHHFKDGDGGKIAGIAYCFRYGCYREEMYDRQKRR